MSEDGFTRITLRIPDDLHFQLTTAASSRASSMNAEIVERLRHSFEKGEDALGSEHPLRLRMKLGAYRELMQDSVTMLSRAINEPEKWLGPVDVPRTTEARDVFQRQLELTVRLLTDIAIAEATGTPIDGPEILERMREEGLTSAMHT